MKKSALAISVFVFFMAFTASTNAEERFSFGRFGSVIVYRPAEIQHAAIVFSDAHGWDKTAAAVAQSLADNGVLVAGVDLQHYANELSKPRDKCSYLAGEFEDFSHDLQKRYSPQRYHLPVLVGVGTGASLVYAITAQGSPGTFAGVLTMGFCPTLPIKINLCHSYELAYDRRTPADPMLLKPSHGLSTPWTALLAQQDKECPVAQMESFITKVGTASSVVIANSGHDFSNADLWHKPLITAFEKLASVDAKPKIVADDLRDLPLEEVKATGTQTQRLVFFLTGDGGWADLDKQVSTQLAKQGNSVIALNSLQYFWKPHTPEQTAADVARVIRHYLVAWNKDEVVLVGYSFGADAMPFIVNRLPADLREKVKSVNVLGLGSNADFEVHVTNWIGVDHHGPATLPEVARLSMPLLCIYGEGEKDTLCPELKGANTHSLMVGDGHHFGGQYLTLAKHIVDFAEAH